MIKVLYANGSEYEWTSVETGLYSDNTPRIVNDLELLPKIGRWCLVKCDEPTQFNAVMMLASYIKSRGVTIDLWIPFFPGARQDRSNDSVNGGDIGLAVKYYADIINNVGFRFVYVLDPHSGAVQKYADKTWRANAHDVISFALKDGIIVNDYDGVIAPDKGAIDRAESVAWTLNVPVFHATKTRDVSNGNLINFKVPKIKPGTYLIVDDICDGGRTFLGLAKALPDGVQCDLYVTHGIFSAGMYDLQRAFRQIITTNSLPQYSFIPKRIDVDDMLVRLLKGER